jgi:hypothetical protein
MPRPATRDHLLKKRAATKTVEVVLDPDAARAVHEAEDRVNRAEARVRVTPDDPAAQEALWAAREQLEGLRAQAAKDDVVVTLRFRSIGRHAYDDLIRQHPPTPDQQDEAKEAGGTLNFNPETFPPAVVAACLEEPRLSVDEVTEMWESAEWNQAELAELFSAAVDVNSRRETLDLGKDSAAMATTGRKSRGARNTASPTASS